MDARDYAYPATAKVHCPKCGTLGEMPVRSNSGYSLEYAVVCQAVTGTGGTCSAALTLEVTAHLFPVEQA